MEALAENVTIRLPNGATLEVPRGATVREVAERIGPRLAKDAVAGKLDGRIVDLVTPLDADGSLEIVTWKSPDAVPIYRHSTAHLTAQAVKRLFPEVQIGIGPPIENGYYYDFTPARPFTPEDLEEIEAEMRKIIAEDLADRAPGDAGRRGDRDLRGPERPAEGRRSRASSRRVSSVSCYARGSSSTSAAGRTSLRPGASGVFKLTHTAGAYWKGDEKNPMLQRIYGASFLTQKELDEYLKRLEEARARDHRKLGTRARALHLPPSRARVPVLPAEGRRPLQRPPRLPAGGVPPPRIRGGHHPADLRRRAVQDLRPLRELPRQHVLHGDRRAGVRRQADELSGPPPALPGTPLVVPRAARALRRLRPPPPLRALRSDGRPDARPHVLAGRLPHLLPDRSDRGGDLRRSWSSWTTCTRHVRFPRRGHLARDPAGPAHRLGRELGQGGGGPRRRRSRSSDVPTS